MTTPATGTHRRRRRPRVFLLPVATRFNQEVIMKATTRLGPLFGLLAAMALLAAPLAAQNAPAPNGGNGSPYDVARAEQLRAKALALYSEPGSWKRVAWLHERAARLRPPDDPRLIGDLVVAAALIDRYGNHRQARRLMEEAAGAALAVGDVAQAAHHYITAAIMANRTNDGATAWKLVNKAQLLANSPLLDKYACDCIRARIIEARAPVAVK
jgi:hypothetical protein